MRGRVQGVADMHGPKRLQPRQMHGVLSGLQRLQAGMGTNQVIVYRSRLCRAHIPSVRLTKDGQTVSGGVKRRYERQGMRPDEVLALSCRRFHQ